MENKGLLFIPDISGFTRFVNETEISHSRLIIQELLELLINSNQIGLEVSEIEGDAILFYKFGASPDFTQLYEQVRKMFCEFHKHLIVYDNRKFCQCKACISAADLSLKVITHYGEFAGYNVKNFNKLIGKDVIIAHQLLKNDIEQHEYWLVTDKMIANNVPDDLEGWMRWNSSKKETETGEIIFHYTQLSELKNDLEPDQLPPLEISDKVKDFSITKDFDTDYITLFHGVGDFNYRAQWLEGVKSVEEVSHFLPRVGTRCKCTMDNGSHVVYASSYIYKPGRIEFSETDEKNNTVYYFTLEQLATKKSRLTVDYYSRKNYLEQFFSRVSGKNKTRDSFLSSLKKLEKVLEDIHLPEPEPL